MNKFQVGDIVTSKLGDEELVIVAGPHLEVNDVGELTMTYECERKGGSRNWYPEGALVLVRRAGA